LHTKSKQANDIVLKDNGVVISEKGEIAELFNENFLKVADDVGLISEIDYGKDFEDHTSIKAIHQHNRESGMPFCFEFHHTNEGEVKTYFLL
jgi:hypothetical protein